MADSVHEQAHEDVSSFRPGTIVDGRYRVLRLIGGGGNGLVHEVEHMRTGQRLALKSLLDPTMYQRLEQEARATSLLKSPRAVKIVDMGTSPTDGPYLVMELLAGQSLRELLHDAGQLPLEMTINIALQVGECLAEAHAAGIIHRDLKPDNIHLAPGPKPNLYDVKVLDFGIVKIGQDAPVPGGSLTRTGSTVGTPYYMSLEQLRNPSGVDGRSDLYSLGVVLYESLSGRKPYDVDTIGDLVYALCSGPPTDLARLRPDLPPPVCRSVMRALGPERDERHESVVDLCRELAPFGDRSVAVWIDEPRAQPPVARPSPGPFVGGAPTPSGVRPKMMSQATEIFSLPEGAPLPAFEPPTAPVAPSSSPSPAYTPPPKEDEGRGRRDTPTTFYVRPDIGQEKPELPERVPDSQKTQMIDASMTTRSGSGPSPILANPNAAVPKEKNPYAKTTPFAVMPDLSNLPPPGTPLPPAFPSQPPKASVPGFGMAHAPTPGASGVFGSPGLNAPPPAATAALPAPSPGSMSGQLPGFRPPSLPPQPHPMMTGQNMPMVNIPGTTSPHPMMTGQNMPRVIPGTISPMMTGSNLPMANIPGTTGPLPGIQPPSWMATSYTGAPKPPPTGLDKIGAFWTNASQKTQIAIASGAAAVFVLVVLLLLWLVVK